MVAVSEKTATKREAVAEGFVAVPRHVFERIAENDVKKGDVLTVAQLAGIMGAKQTPNLIPLCHPLPLTFVDVKLNLHGTPLAADPSDWAHVHITSTVQCVGVTGVEMEALTAVSIAALTVYDMVKAVSPLVRVTDIRLVKKTGGKQDFSR